MRHHAGLAALLRAQCLHTVNGTCSAASQNQPEQVVPAAAHLLQRGNALDLQPVPRIQDRGGWAQVMGKGKGKG